MKVIDPKCSYSCQFFIVEDADAMRWSKQAVPYNHIRKIVKALFFAQPLLERILENMCCNFHNGTKFLKLPMSKLRNNSLNKLIKKLK